LANDSVESIAFNKMTFGTSPFSLVQTNNSYQLLENFSKVTGNHSVKLGGQFLYQAVKLLPDLIANEQFQFFGSATGMDFADFLLGLPSVYNQGFSPAFYQRSRYAGLYGQDSWRLKPNLTFNYGLRWDMIMPWYERHNQTGTLILGQRSQLFPGAPPGYVFPGDSGVPRTIAATPYDNFSPRIGLAYSPAWTNRLLATLTGGPGQSSIRTGVGRFLQPLKARRLLTKQGTLRTA
jgi:outer membrane receptor protein involved in Fe transport